jgi:hypothetical protein
VIPPEDEECALSFGSKLCAFGVSLPAYIQALNPSTVSETEER